MKAALKISGAIRFNNNVPVALGEEKANKRWKDPYPFAKENISIDALDVKGNGLEITTEVDVGRAHDLGT